MPDADAQYRPLGYDGPLYYVLSGAKQQMAGYTAGQLMSAAGCLDIVSDHDYWADYFADARRKRIDWQRAGSHVMRQCLDAGLFDPARVRGRGVWLDQDRTVLHLGTSVEGIPDDSAYIYQMRPTWLPGYDGTPGDCGPVLEACRAVPWVAPISAELLAGWIALAPICGALAHRAHVRIEGDAGDVARACLGALAATDASGQDARPVLTDIWTRPTGPCMILSTGKLPDATVLAVGTGSGGAVLIPHDMPHRLLARGVAGLDVVRNNVRTFRACATQLGLGADIGVLMAGAWSLYSSEVLSAELARGFLGRYGTGE